jgi:hypothetical protein
MRIPAFLFRNLKGEPLRQRAHGRDADPLFLEIAELLDRRIILHDDAEQRRRDGDGADGGLGRALDQKGDIGAGAEAEIDGARGHRLVQLGAAAEIDLTDIDAVLLEEFLLDADAERQELKACAELLPTLIAELARAGATFEAPMPRRAAARMTRSAMLIDGPFDRGFADV